MKKLSLTLIAFATLSAAACASNRDVTTPTGSQGTKQDVHVTINALVIGPHRSTLTNFERMMKQSEEGGEDRGGRQSQVSRK